MHILHVIDSLAAGGAERMLVDIANASIVAGLRVSVCVTRSRADLAAGLNPQIQQHILNRAGRFETAPMRRLGDIVRRDQVDVVHIHGRSSFSFVVVAQLLGFIPRSAPLVLHDHYGKIEIDFSVPRWFQLVGRHRLSAYVGVSPRLGDWARAAGVPVAKIHVIENALDLDRLRPSSRFDVRAALGLAPSPLGILVCGIRPEKGVDLLIDAAAQQTLPVQFLIVGADTDPAYAAQCRALVMERGLGERVRFLGARMDVPALLSGCDFAVMPSRSESGPLTLIEYLCAGLPIVSTRAGSIGMRLADAGVAGFVPPGDGAALANEIDAVLRLDPAGRAARGQAGARVVAQLFDIHSAIPHWTALYEGLIAQRIAQ